MKRLIFFLAVAALAAPALQAVTLNDTITVTSTAPVDHFEVRVKDGITFALLAISFPADDPDLDGDIEVAPDATGLVGTISVSKFLTGQPTGAYIAEAAAFDANGQASGWGTKNFTYSPPPNPTITVGYNSEPVYQNPALPERSVAASEVAARLDEEALG